MNKRLNPITALRDSFEKLIVEHGSAIVQEKHIALFKDQLSIAEKENAKLIMEIGTLQSKLCILEAENQKLEDQNIQLKDKIQSYEQSPLDLTAHEIEKKIMLHLKNSPKATIQQISTSTGISIQKVREALELYRRCGGVSSALESPDGDSLWSLL